MDVNARIVAANGVLDTNTRIVELAASAGTDLMTAVRDHTGVPDSPWPPAAIILANNAATTARLRDSGMGAGVGMPINPGDWVRLDIGGQTTLDRVQYLTQGTDTLIAMVLF